MRAPSRTRIAAIALSIAVVLAGVCFAFQGGSRGELYASPPFMPVEPEYPRIIPVTEAPPRSNAVAYNAWLRDYRAVQLYLKEGGAMSRATDLERQAIKAAMTDKFREAREAAEKSLEANPDSMPGRFALACVHYEGEQNFPRALNLLRGLRWLCEDRGRLNAADADAREWYIRTLDVEQRLLGDMDRIEEQLQAIDCIEKVYQPVPWKKAWPLMKLKREAEARAAIESAAAMGNPRRSINALAALESKLHNRPARYEILKKLTESQPDSAVIWCNFGNSAWGMYRFDEAERALMKSAQMPRIDFSGTPYMTLAGLYNQQARFMEAFDALSKAQVQRSRRDPYTLIQDEASMQRAIASLQLSLGLNEEALRSARKAFEFQDRSGSTSADADDLFLRNGVRLYHMLCNRIEDLREQPDASATERRLLEVEAWTLKRDIIRLLDGKRLAEAFRPPYEIEDYLSILPPGVAAEAIRKARVTDRELQIPGDAAALDAMEAEVLYRLGEWNDAYAMSRRALEGLHPSLRLDRAIMHAIAGDCAARAGNLDEAMQHWETTLRDRPVSFRLLGIVLPVQIAHDGSPAGERAAELLRKSCRFQEKDGGFKLNVAVRDGQMVIEFRGANGTMVRDVRLPATGSTEELAVKTAKTFLARLYQPKVDMSQMNMGSLESGIGALADTRELNQVLESRR